MADRIVKVVLRGDVKGLQASMAAASKSVADTANRLTDTADKASGKWRKGMTAVGDTAGKVGLVAAAGLGAVVAASANFDKAMSNVAATGDEARGSMDALREAAIKAGADTAFSASEAAAGIENLLKAGVSAKDVLAGGLSGALDLAAAGQLEVADAAEIAATALTQFNLQGADVPHVADLLAAGAGKAQGEVSDLGMALKQSGLVAGQMGLSIEETTGTLAAFASAGLLGSDAGTSFKTMLLRLANPSAEAADIMKQLGINAYDANGNLVSMSDLAGQLQGAFKGQTQATRDAALATLFGSDAIRAANVLYSQGSEGITDWTNKVNDSGYAAETAATKLDNLAGDWEAFTGSLETALIGAGSGSQGILRDLVQGATAAVNAFNKLPGPAQNTATALLGITAVTGGGLWFGSKVVQGVSNTRDALENLGVSSTKAKGALKGLGTAATVVGGVFAGLAIADQIAKIGDEGLPGLEALEGQLIDLAAAGASAKLSQEFDSLGESIDRLTDKNTAQKINDSLAGAFGVGEGRSLREAKAEVEALDAALAGLVTSGHAEVAARALENLGLSSAEMADLKPLLTGYSDALASVENDAKLAASGTDQLTGATADATGAIADNTAAIQDNIDAMREQRSEVLRGLNAEIDYQASLDDARKALKENGRTLDITTEKGRANKTALLAVAAAWNDQSAAAKNAPGAHRAAIASFVDLAKKMGMSEDKARALARRILEIPSKNVKVTADTSQALSAAGRLISIYAGIPRYIETQAITRHIDKFERMAQANGGIVDYFANGSENHVAQIAPAGAWRVWAEPETGGEAYIPLSPSKRGRSLDIWRAVGDRLGVQFAEYAEGGVNAKKRDPFTGKEYARETREFNLTGDQTWREVRAELRDFAREVREAGGSVGKNFATLSARSVSVARSLDAHEKALDASRDKLKQLRDDRSQYAGSVRSTFSGDLFGNGVAGLRTQLEADRNDARAMRAALSAAAARGLDGGLFKELAASGDLNTAQQYATMSRAQIARDELLYQQAQQERNNLASYSSDRAFASAIAAQERAVNAQVRATTKLERRLEGLESAVERGARRGVGDRDRNASTRRRAGK